MNEGNILAVVILILVTSGTICSLYYDLTHQSQMDGPFLLLPIVFVAIIIIMVIFICARDSLVASGARRGGKNE